MQRSFDVAEREIRVVDDGLTTPERERANGRFAFFYFLQEVEKLWSSQPEVPRKL